MRPCVLTPACLNNNGYGMLTVRGRNVLAHRKAYAEANGLDVHFKGGVVRHSCDTPACVEPTHLTLGTQAENMQDAADRGRVKSGELHPHAVLNWGAVARIREVHVARHKQYGCRALAREYGCSHTIISDIVLGVSWKANH